MENRNNLDNEYPTHASAATISPASAPQPSYNKPASSSALSPAPTPTPQLAPAPPWPNKLTRSGIISPAPTEPVAPAAGAIFPAAAEPKVTCQATIYETVQPQALEPTTRAVTQTAASGYAHLPATVPAPVPSSVSTPPASISDTQSSVPAIPVHIPAPATTKPVNSLTTPHVHTPEPAHTSTTAPQPEKPFTREPASAPPLVPKDKHKGGKHAMEAATTAATIGGLVVGTVDTVLQNGNGNSNSTKAPDPFSVPDDSESCWENFCDCEDCCDCF